MTKESKFVSCKCGCGERISRYNRWGREKQYVHGHGARTKKGEITDLQATVLHILNRLPFASVIIIADIMKTNYVSQQSARQCISRILIRLQQIGMTEEVPIDALKMLGLSDSVWSITTQGKKQLLEWRESNSIYYGLSELPKLVDQPIQIFPLSHLKHSLPTGT